MIPQIKKFIPYLIALIAGGLLPLAFAPISWFFLAVISPIILIALWRTKAAKQIFILGWFYGLGVFAVGVSWVFVSIHVFGNVNLFLALFFTFLFVAIMALFFATQGLIYRWLELKLPLHSIIILFPTTWLLFEWLRGWLFTGFPWLFIAYSQTNSPLKGFIPIVGEYGTGFLVLLTSALIFYGFEKIHLQRKQNKKIGVQPIIFSFLAIILIWTSGYCLSLLNWTQAKGKPLTVSLIQGDIPQNLKWSPQYVDFILNRYTSLTALQPNKDLIVWPEGAIPVPLPQAKELLRQLDTEANSNNTAFLTGIPVLVPNSFSNYYNAIVGLGAAQGFYYKRHLVPFGEYIPFQTIVGNIFAILHIPMSDFVPGPLQQKDLLVKNIPVAPFICYEIAYAHELQSLLPKAEFLLTISDDAWFGNSFAPAQHLQIGQFRAIESGRPLLFDSNDGITAIIDSHGKILSRAPQFEPYNLSGVVQPFIGTTPWIKLGNWPIITILFLVIIIAYALKRRKLRQRNLSHY